MARLRTTARFFLLTAAACAAFGCASGPAPRDHYYRLTVGKPPAPGQPALDGTLAVDRVRVEAISEGRRMLYRESADSNEISQYSYNLWADPPSVMLQDQLVAYLRAAGVARQVLTTAVHVDADYRLTGRLVRFERVLGGGAPHVAVSIELMLMRNADGALLLLTTYTDERAAAGSGVDASVAAYGAAVTAIFERFVADLPRS